MLGAKLVKVTDKLARERDEELVGPWRICWAHALRRTSRQAKDVDVL